MQKRKVTNTSVFLDLESNWEILQDNADRGTERKRHVPVQLNYWE